MENITDLLDFSYCYCLNEQPLHSHDNLFKPHDDFSD